MGLEAPTEKLKTLKNSVAHRYDLLIFIAIRICIDTKNFVSIYRRYYRYLGKILNDKIDAFFINFFDSIYSVFRYFYRIVAATSSKLLFLV